MEFVIQSQALICESNGLLGLIRGLEGQDWINMPCLALSRVWLNSLDHTRNFRNGYLS